MTRRGPIAMKLYTDAELSKELREQMWALYQPYHHITREEFDRRWRELDHVAVFTRRRRVIGIVGMRYKVFIEQGVDYLCLYFGQVFIEPEFRRRMLIQRLVTSEYLKQKMTRPSRRMVFWSDALTYRPHLLMMNYLQDYYPHLEHETPEHIVGLLSQIGAHYYGEEFDPLTGTVHKRRRTVRKEISMISARELQHPGIKFYARCNPGHEQGHGLLIMCPLTMKNLAYFIGQATRRLIRSR